jgi:hypothetical protein
MRAAASKQKPNDACACGSGGKFKKCCGSAAGAGAAAAQRLALTRAGAAAAPTVPARPQDRPSPETLNRAFEEAGDAVEAGEWARALRRVAYVLSPAGAALAAAHTHYVGERAPWAVAQMAEVARVIVQCLNYAVNAKTQPGRPLLSEACDAHARALALLAPPHTFWARALTDLTHAGWRDSPLEGDERVTLPPAVTAPLCRKLLSETHEVMAEGFGRMHGHPADAIACYERSLAALALEPPSAVRDYMESNRLQSLGHLHRGAGRTGAARECFTRGLALVRRLRDDDPEEQARSVRHLESCLAILNVDMDLENDQEQYQMYEAGWDKPRDGFSAEQVAVNLCTTVLAYTRSAARQRTWLLRAVRLEGAAEARRGAAMRACRGCGAGVEDAATKVKLCGGCGRFAFCSPACQAADWRRHKRHCAAGPLADSAEAALADATCSVCRRALVPDDDSDASEEAYQAVVLPACMHLAHAACIRDRGCAVCG